MLSQSDIEGNLDLLANKGGLAKPRNPPMDHKHMHSEQQGRPRQKRRKIKSGHFSHCKESLSASATVILLQSLVMSDFPSDPDSMR